MSGDLPGLLLDIATTHDGAVQVITTGLTPDPAATAAPFALLDVLESELLDLDGMGVAR